MSCIKGHMAVAYYGRTCMLRYHRIVGGKALLVHPDYFPMADREGMIPDCIYNIILLYRGAGAALSSATETLQISVQAMFFNAGCAIVMLEGRIASRRNI